MEPQVQELSDPCGRRWRCSWILNTYRQILGAKTRRLSIWRSIPMVVFLRWSMAIWCYSSRWRSIYIWPNSMGQALYQRIQQQRRRSFNGQFGVSVKSNPYKCRLSCSVFLPPKSSRMSGSSNRQPRGCSDLSQFWIPCLRILPICWVLNSRWQTSMSQA